MHKDGSGTIITQDEIVMRVQKHTEIDNRDYPTEWKISIPNHEIELTVSALNPNAKMPLSVPYWEGPVTIQGSHSGSGYMELTGY
jgi:predicted secreted hydrolase